MKITTGFISNSSSSSFIVSFDKDPTDKNNLIEMMGECGVDFYGTVITKEEVIDTIHDQITKGKTIVRTSKVGDIDRWDYEYTVQDYVDTSNMTDDMWEHVLKLEHAHREKIYSYITGESPDVSGKFIYEFEFSDNDGLFWSAMEHGDVFRNIPCDKISNH